MEKKRNSHKILFIGLGTALLFFALLVGLIGWVTIQNDETEQQKVDVLLMRTDMLYLNEEIDDMSDVQVRESVKSMKNRLTKAESRANGNNNILLQRWLGECNGIMLRFHDELEERDIHLIDTSQKAIVY